MDGWYVTRSQGWRCDEYPWMDGHDYVMAQGARDGGAMNVHGWMAMITLYRKEPGMAVR